MTEVKSQGGVSKEQTFAQAVARAAAAQLPAFKWPVARDMTTLLTLQSILGSVLDHAIPEEERTQRATLSKVNELYTVPLDLSGRDWDTVLNVLQARNGVYHGHPYLVSDFEDDMVILEKQVLALTNEWSAADKTTLVRFYLLIEEFPRKWSVIAQEANNAERPPTWQQIARVFPELAQFGQESSNIVNVGRFLELGSKPGLGALYKPLLGTTKRTPKQVAQDFAPSLQTRPSSVAPMRASTTTVVPVSVTAPLAASVASTASMAAASAMSLGGRSSPRSVDEFSSRAAAAFEIDLDNLSRLLNESKAAQLGAKDIAQTTADETKIGSASSFVPAPASTPTPSSSSLARSVRFPSSRENLARGERRDSRAGIPGKLQSSMYFERGAQEALEQPATPSPQMSSVQTQSHLGDVGRVVEDVPGLIREIVDLRDGSFETAAQEIVQFQQDRKELRDFKEEEGFEPWMASTSVLSPFIKYLYDSFGDTLIKADRAQVFHDVAVYFSALKNQLTVYKTSLAVARLLVSSDLLRESDALENARVLRDLAADPMNKDASIAHVLDQFRLWLERNPEIQMRAPGVETLTIEHVQGRDEKGQPMLVTATETIPVGLHVQETAGLLSRALDLLNDGAATRRKTPRRRRTSVSGLSTSAVARPTHVAPELVSLLNDFVLQSRFGLYTQLGRTATQA